MEIKAIQSFRSVLHDAMRFRTLMATLQNSYDGSPPCVEAEGVSISCNMESGWRNTRLVNATIRWQDVRDADLDLGSALDALSHPLQQEEGIDPPVALQNTPAVENLLQSINDLTTAEKNALLLSLLTDVE